MADKQPQRTKIAEFIGYHRHGGGDTLDQQLEKIDKDGVVHTFQRVRRTLLHGLVGQRKPSKAANVIMTGCAFIGMPVQMHACFKLLDKLDVDYTYLRDIEYCCAWPSVESWQGTERERAIAASREFMEKNLVQARDKGAKNMLHFCQWCAYLGKWHFSKSDVNQMYFLDVVVDRIKGRPLKVKPMVIAYYEGCHRRQRHITPGVELNWEAYRRILDNVEGLEVIDLSTRVCCTGGASRIIEQAMQKNVSTLVTPCAACWTWLERDTRLHVKLLPELLVEAMV